MDFNLIKELMNFVERKNLRKKFLKIVLSEKFSIKRLRKLYPLNKDETLYLFVILSCRIHESLKDFIVSELIWVMKNE